MYQIFWPWHRFTENRSYICTGRHILITELNKPNHCLQKSTRHQGAVVQQPACHQNCLVHTSDQGRAW